MGCGEIRCFGVYAYAGRAGLTEAVCVGQGGEPAGGGSQVRRGRGEGVWVLERACDDDTGAGGGAGRCGVLGCMHVRGGRD